MSRVSKKLVPDLQDISGAVLLVNAKDPQLTTIGVFLEAIEDIPYFVVLNKVDSCSTVEAQEIADRISLHQPCKILWASVTKGRGLGGVILELTKLPWGKIAILGIFNSGKTSLINKLTGEDNPVGDIPGTTLEFTLHNFGNHTLVDTVGQVVDVSKPLMVSLDITNCDTIEEKVRECLEQDLIGIKETSKIVILKIVEAVELLHTQINKGKKVVVSGAGASALVAMEIAGQGQETGVPIMVFTNNFASCQPVSFAKGFGEDELAMAEYSARAVEFGDVVIGVSASGGTASVHELLRIARTKGAKTIAITENSDTPIGKYADIIIKSEAKPEGPSSSRIQIAHLAIGHALMITLADIRGIDAQSSIKYMLPDKVPNKRMGIK